MDMFRVFLYRSAAKFLALIAAIAVNSSIASAQERRAQPVGDSPARSATLPLPSGMLIPVNLNVKDWKHAKSGQVLEGHLSLPLYGSQQTIVPAGTTVRVTIESVERVRPNGGTWKTIGRGIVKAFNPLDKSASPQYHVKLRSAEIVGPEEVAVPMQAEVLLASTSLIVRPQEERSHKTTHSSASKKSNSREVHSRLLLRLEEPIEWQGPAFSADSGEAQTAQGARGRAFLLDGLSASQTQEGDRFHAVLAEPVRLGGQTFDAGSVVEGSVMRRAPPRMLSRAGSLYLRVDRLTSQQQTIAVDGSLVAAESGTGTPPVLDEEGILHGRKPGVKNALVDLGIAYVVGKASDDIAETPIRAVGAAMSDAAVANAARYFGLAGSAIFLVTRHGRDVRLPQYAEIEIDFGRVNQAASTGN